MLSSGAQTALLARGPYDVANLARLFGLDHGVAKRALSANPHAVGSLSFF